MKRQPCSTSLMLLTNANIINNIEYTMKKIVFANCGAGNQGKSSSVKEVYHLLNSKYKAILMTGGADIKATIRINGGSCGSRESGRSIFKGVSVIG